MSWNQILNLPMGRWSRPIPLTNSFGAVVPPSGQLIPPLFSIRPGERVLDVGGGSQPLPRADVVVEPNLEDGAHRGGREAGVDGRTVRAHAEALPFADRSFDFVHCRQVLEHVDDPLAACRELMRVGKRGFLETPRKAYDVLMGPNPSHQWLVSSVDGALIFERRTFVRHPFGHPGLAPAPNSAEGQAIAHWELANLTNVQFYWEDGFDVEVHDDGGGFRYADDTHAAYAHLDSAFCGLRLAGSPAEHRLADAEAACRRLPDFAPAHAVRGLWLRKVGRTPAATLAMNKARTLAVAEGADPAWASLVGGLLAGDLRQHPVAPGPLDRMWWSRLAHDGGVDLAAAVASPARREAPSFRSDPRISRFVRTGDPRIDTLVYPLPEPWWSRGHEYAWALQFAEADHVVLDAASGICHPLKFALAERCREAHACDLDPRIVDTAAIRADIGSDFGADAAADTLDARIDAVARRCCSITDLPYADGCFDRVFCISVLEHMSPEDRGLALRAFARVTVRGGLVVLTMDHPLVDIGQFAGQALEAGLRFVSEVRVHVPPDALYSTQYGLRCFRALLTHI